MDKVDEISASRYGLLGEKLSHSFSKLIHEELCDNSYAYDLIEVSRDKLDEFMQKKQFSAINVTIPYKEAVIPYLDDIDEHAKAVGAVNTIINENGRLKGYNTDYAGACYMLSSARLSLKNETLLILGSGGTCKTLTAVARDMGAKKIYTASRSSDTSLHGQSNIISYEKAYSLCDEITFIINASPVGMYPNIFASPIDLSAFKLLNGVAEVIYNPLKTSLLQQAESLSLKHTGGLSMLVAQAKYASEYFRRGVSIPQTEIERILNKLRLSQSNFVLIGMPGCGKSRLGRELSKKTDRRFIDIDFELEQRYNKTIPDIFEQEGEEGFRQKEQEIIKELSAEHSLVISTGGGVVTRWENINNLRKNGILCFINRSVELLPTGGKRPLSADVQSLEKMLAVRFELYKKASDFTIDNNGEFEETLKSLIAAFE